MRARSTPLCHLLKSLLFVFVGGLAFQAHAVGSIGVQWSLRNPSLTNESFTSVASNGDASTASTVVVAVGTRGTIVSATSAAGPWTLRASGTTANINAVAWSQSSGVFVAVGDAGTLLTSPNGTAWTLRPLNWLSGTTTQVAKEDFTCVTWTTNNFFVGGNSSAGAAVYGNVLTDPTSSWGKFPVIPGARIHAISGTQSTYVFAFTDTKLYSHNANFSPVTAWTANPWPTPETYIQSGIYTVQGPSPGSVVSGVATYSSSGFTNWTAQKSGGNNLDPDLNLTWNLSASGSVVLGVGANGAVWASPSGNSNWSKLPVVEEGLQLHGGTKFSTSYVVVGDGGRIYSYDTVAAPTTWTSGYSAGVDTNLTAVGVQGSYIVALGKNVSMLSQDDGVTWAPTTTTVDAFSVAGVGTPTGFIAVGTGIWTSSDAVTWVPSATTFFGRLNRVRATGANQAIAVGASTPAIGPLASMIYTFDGTNWTNVTLPAGSNQELRGVAALASLTVAVGDGGEVLTLSAGKWTKSTVVLAKGEGFTDVLGSGTQFLASTSLGGIWSSTDGIKWTKRQASSPAGISRIVDTVNGSEQLVAVGGKGQVVRSFAGGYWYVDNAGTVQSFADAVWTGTSLVAVGAHGTIETSSGSEPARPTLSFALASSSCAESVGTFPVTVQLSPASLQTVTVAFAGTTTTGTNTAGHATLGTDYSLPTPALLTFAPGDTSKTINVTIKQDTIVEGAETATLTLSAPTGDAALGTQAQHLLTINDDDIKPYFATGGQPQYQLVALGAPLTLTATAGGQALPTALWKKNNAAVTGATFHSTTNTTGSPATDTATLTCGYTSAALTQAGAYTVLLTNQTGTLLSSTAQIGVVDNTSRGLAVALNGTATIMVNTAGNGLTYQWMRSNNGGTATAMVDTTDKLITGSKTSKLVIKSMTTAQNDTYYCVVTQAAPVTTPPAVPLSITGGTTIVSVVDDVPSIAAIVFPSTTLFVGQYFYFLPSASLLPAKWTITGLPPGLSYDPTFGYVYGQPTRAGDYIITFTATNVLGTSTPLSAMLTVAPLPPGITGNFMGLMTPSTVRSVQVNIAALTNSVGGRFDLTVTDTGAYSGKLSYGSASAAISGALDYYPPPTDPVSPPVGYVNPGLSYGSYARVAIKGFPAVDLYFTIYPSSSPSYANQMFVDVYDDGNDYFYFTGWRNNWLNLNAALATTVANYTGTYHFATAPRYSGVNTPGIPDQALPQGYSFASFKLASDGTVILSGQMADGAAYTSSGFIDATPPTVATVNGYDIPVYSGLYANTGAYNGQITLIAGVDKNVTPNVTNYEYNTLSGPGTTFWTKNPQTVATRSYAAGFGTVAAAQTNRPNFAGVLQVISQSGRYTPPQGATEVVMGITKTTTGAYANNVTLSFADGGINYISDATTNPPTRTMISAQNPSVDFFSVSYPAVVTIAGSSTGTTLSFVPSTGTFSGGFTLTDTIPNGAPPTVTRNVTFTGLIIGHRNVTKRNGDGAQVGYGFFILPQLPSTGNFDLSGGARVFRSVNVP